MHLRCIRKLPKMSYICQIWSVCCSIIVLRLVDIVEFTVLLLASSKCLFFSIFRSTIVYMHIYVVTEQQNHRNRKNYTY